MKQIPLASLLLALASCCSAKAEVPLLSPDELYSKSSHIVVGEVRAVYSTTEESESWQDTSRIAEISVRTVEKGAGIKAGDVVYALYWNKRWIGEGDPEPHASGHNGVSKGDVVRAHLQRKVYRVTDDAFAEIRGVLIGDDNRLAAFTWQRVRE